MKPELSPLAISAITSESLAESGIISFIVFCFLFGHFGLFWMTLGGSLLHFLLYGRVVIGFRKWKARRKLAAIPAPKEVLHNDVGRAKK